MVAKRPLSPSGSSTGTRTWHETALRSRAQRFFPIGRIREPTRPCFRVGSQGAASMVACTRHPKTAHTTPQIRGLRTPTGMALRCGRLLGTRFHLRVGMCMHMLECAQLRVARPACVWKFGRARPSPFGYRTRGVYPCPRGVSFVVRSVVVCVHVHAASPCRLVWVFEASRHRCSMHPLHWNLNYRPWGASRICAYGVLCSKCSGLIPAALAPRLVFVVGTHRCAISRVASRL